jgi:very-short-patch-repair endonuclease
LPLLTTGPRIDAGPNQPTNRARSLRQTDNDAESKLWNELRNRQINGFKFLRQLPIGRYFADLACREKHLVVEVDGSQMPAALTIIVGMNS